jgi:small subunit ribosomal protein S9
MEKQKNGVGRRKEAVTRVFIAKGDGKITVNDKDYKNISPWFTCKTR